MNSSWKYQRVGKKPNIPGLTKMKKLKKKRGKIVKPQKQVKTG